jgi:MFS-type transporter involved in bile tolerance (Atg22 family)
MYDWANSAVVTLIIASVFPVYYNEVLAKELGPSAASVFAFTGAIALLLSALTGPIIGTLSDVTGRRKRFLILSTTFGSLAVCALFTARAGAWAWGSLLFILIQLGLNISFTFYDALLPHVALLRDRDRLSALGYGLGYVGGGLHLALCTFLIVSPGTFGITGEFAAESATRIALVSAGVWWFIFALPLFFIVPEPPAAPLEKGQTGNALRDSLARLRETLRQIRGYRELFKMLVAFWLYGDGIGTIIALATTYGSQQLRLDRNTLIGALLLTQFVAFPFAIMFGRIPNRDAQNRAFFLAFALWAVITFPIMAIFVASAQYAQYPDIAAALAGHIDRVSVSPVSTLVALVANQAIGLVFCWFVGRNLVAGLARRLDTQRTILLGLGVYVIVAIWGFFLYTPAEFWMLAWLVGTAQGGTQALSRSLYSELTPRSKSGEFFGFYSLTDKFGSIFGLLLFGLIGLATGGNLRVAILSVIFFFGSGAYLLSRVNVAEGQRIARTEDVAIHYHDDLPEENAAQA